jgi:hypothetical protein
MPHLSTLLVLLLSIAGGAALVPLIARRRARAASRAERNGERAARMEHLLRLASEIAVVTRTIESDLTPFRSLPALEALQSRARRIRLHAEATLATSDRLLDLPWFELESEAEKIHAAHFRSVALRATADAEISGWRKHVRRGIEAEKSTLAFLTTPMSSGFDA